MSQDWQLAFVSLQQYIEAHPEIRIERRSIIIPENVRTEFYRNFDTVREAFIRDTLPELLVQAEALSSAYLSAESEMKHSLPIDSVSLPNPLGWFLRNPVEGLMRELFDPVFDLLKGEIDVTGFAEAVSAKMTDSLTELYQQGYDKWTALALMNVLRCDESLRVVVRRPAEHREWTIIRSTKGQEAVPYPEPSSTISFVHFPENIFVVPDFIAHSPILNGFISFRSGMHNAVATAINSSDERQWCPYETPVYSESHPLFVYTDSNPGNINLVADATRICRPDLIIQTTSLTGASREQSLARSVYWQESLCPSLGTVLIGEYLKDTVGEIPNGVQLLETRLEPATLFPIVEIIKKKIS